MQDVRVVKVGRGILRRVNFTLRRRVDGRHIRVPVIAGVKVGLSGEPFLLDILKSFLPQLHGAFVDVGANLGQTLCKVELASPGRCYYGFEPNSACQAYLEALVSSNGWSNVSLFPCGLANRAAVLPLHVSSHRPTDGRASLFPDVRPELDLTASKYAAFVAFSDVAHLLSGPLAIVKIDVEGAEPDVLQSMADVIQCQLPIIVLEMMPVPRLEEQHRHTVELLRSFGYDVFGVLKSAEERWVGLEPVETYSAAVQQRRSDYLAVPRSRLSELQIAGLRLDHAPGDMPAHRLNVRLNAASDS